MVPNGWASIDVLTGDLECEADWDFAELTGGPGLGSKTSICGDNGRHHEACSVVNSSGLSLGAGVLSFLIRHVEAIAVLPY